MRKLLFAVSLAVAGTFAFAEGQTYTWTGSVDDDWNKPGNFTVDGETAESVPGSEDTVLLPEGTELAFNTVTDAASFAVFANVYRISPARAGSCRVEITVPSEEDEATVNAALTYSQNSKEANLLALGNLLTVVKRGSGTLHFTAVGRFVSSALDATLNVSFDVQQGTVILPQNFNGDVKAYFGDVHVAEGATVVLPYKTVSGKETHFGSLALDEGGVVSNGTATTGYFAIHGDSLVKGSICGSLQFNVYGETVFADENAAYDSQQIFQLWEGGTAASLDFGRVGDGGCFGGLRTFVTRGGSGGLLYLGTAASETDKDFELWANNEDSAGFIDGGAYGGLDWTGRLSMRTSSSKDYAMQRLVLTGSNTVPCVVSGVIEAPTKQGMKGFLDNDTNYTFRITKKGTGAWHLKYNEASDMRGVIAVEEGALRFDNVAETNVNSSLGKSTILQEDVAGVLVDPAKYGVDYAFAAGDPNDAWKTGVFEYVGATNCVATTRLFAIQGRGGVVNNGGGWLHLKGFSPLGTGTRTLVLGGTNELDNVAEGVTGALDVEKAGSGTWKLTGSQTFTGGISVTGGKLIVERPKYTWFRWTVQQRFTDGGSGDSGTKRYIVGVSEFALYDAAGNRVGLNLADNGSNAPDGNAYYYSPTVEMDAVFASEDGVRKLESGKVDLAGDYRVRTYGESGTANRSMLLSELFDANTSTLFSGYRSGAPSSGDENSWFAILMRVPQDTADVRYWDFVHSSRAGRGVQMSKLEASADGRVWKEVGTASRENYPTTANTWDFKNVAYGSEAEAQTAVGREITARPEGAQDFLMGSRAVSVAAGATLEVRGTTLAVSKLTVDAAAGAGALKGVALDEDGELHVENAPTTGAYDVPIDFTGSDAANAAGWTVYEGGRMKSSRKITVTPTGLRVEPSGMILILR